MGLFRRRSREPYWVYPEPIVTDLGRMRPQQAIAKLRRSGDVVRTNSFEFDGCEHCYQCAYPKSRLQLCRRTPTKRRVGTLTSDEFESIWVWMPATAATIGAEDVPPDLSWTLVEGEGQAVVVVP